MAFADKITEDDGRDPESDVSDCVLSSCRDSEVFGSFSEFVG